MGISDEIAGFNALDKHLFTNREIAPTLDSTLAHAEQIRTSPRGPVSTWQQELLVLAKEIDRLRAELNAVKIVMSLR